MPRPAGIHSMPYSRTENRLLNLMADERNLTDHSWIKHAQVLVTYLEGRLMLYGAAEQPPAPATASTNGHAIIELTLVPDVVLNVQNGYDEMREDLLQPLGDVGETTSELPGLDA